jgi:branched-subunit amino acid aminotransferase/4-amino-4-deoxychorismate lyase
MKPTTSQIKDERTRLRLENAELAEDLARRQRERDAALEALRVARGRIATLEAHIQRLRATAAGDAL